MGLRWFTLVRKYYVTKEERRQRRNGVKFVVLTIVPIDYSRKKAGSFHSEKH